MAMLLAQALTAFTGAMVGDEIVEWIWDGVTGGGEVTDGSGNIITDLLRLGPGLPFIELFADPKNFPADTEGHGPIVKDWQIKWESGGKSGTNAFVLTQDGWIGSRRKNMTWTWHKPKKPMVIMPGAGLTTKQSRKLARIYKKEEKEAKKMFGLVSKQPPKRRSYSRRAPDGNTYIFED